jgi:alginate O-acetyltransferase complex protein AlgI
MIIFTGQVSTMFLIGLWHGVTWNYFMWGAWHGIGLFIHNRWSDWIKTRTDGLNSRPYLQRTMRIGSWLITFNYVTLGWVWFALPDPAMAETVFRRLAGLN